MPAKEWGRAKTPRLDALAVSGARFAHATAQVPLTLPSHACILTGTYPVVHQLRDMGGFVLDPKCQTLATMAKNQVCTRQQEQGQKQKCRVTRPPRGGIFIEKRRLHDPAEPNVERRLPPRELCPFLAWPTRRGKKKGRVETRPDFPSMRNPVTKETSEQIE